MSPRLDALNPISCYTADAISGLLAGVTLPLMVGAAVACIVGAFTGQVVWYCFHHFILRRFRTWARFQRALDKVHA